MRVVHVVPEIFPYTNTGVVAEIVAGLTSAQAEAGCEVSIVAPLYRAVDRGIHGLQRGPKDVDVDLGPERCHGSVYLGELDSGVRTYLVGSADFYDRDGIYGSAEGPFVDNHRRFAFLSRAALEVIRRYALHPHVIHCHDWQTATLPVYAQQEFGGFLNTLLTIHDIDYQGILPKEFLPEIGLAWDFYTVDGLEYWGQVNLLKGGILFSDRVTVDSPTFAEEITSDSDAAKGLDGVLSFRGERLDGVPCGLDPSVWDPASDERLPASFDAENLDGKAVCKMAVQRDLGLEDRPDVPLFAAILSTAARAGSDLLLAAVEALAEDAVQVVLIGEADAETTAAIELLRDEHPQALAIHPRPDEASLIRTLAAADALLMPARSESTGMMALRAMRYGAVPVARATGALADLIEDVGDGGEEGVGFTFAEPSATALTEAAERAHALYAKPERWRALVQRTMRHPQGWERVAHRYQEIYADIVAEL